LLISSFFSVKPHVLFLAQDEEESLSDGSTASCPTGKRPVIPPQPQSMASQPSAAA